MAKLRTRKPTGQAPWPFILVEGPEKSGKSWAQLSASPRVGRMVVCIIGESDGDAYAALPGADYELIEHNGSYSDILGQLQAATVELATGGPPPVLVVDSVSNLWSLLVDEAQLIANSRAQRRNRKRTDEEAQITMDLWNQAKTRWRRVIDVLMMFPGISIATARGKEVSEMEGSIPTGDKAWKVEAEKSLTFDVDVWIRTIAGRQALLVGARSVRAGIHPAMSQAMTNFTLERVIFERLGLGEEMGTGSYVPLKTGEVELEPEKPQKPEEPIIWPDSDQAERWHAASKRLHALISECGLNGAPSRGVREALKKAKGVESYKHLAPDYLEETARRLAAQSPHSLCTALYRLRSFSLQKIWFHFDRTTA